ncbi:MAG: GAF domain-containing protein [Anaerolineales bacterium]|nr:GAF domain-containing protein [Anaerolineales bacterium]
MDRAHPPRSLYTWSFLGPWLLLTAAGGAMGVGLALVFDTPWLVGLALGLIAGSLAGMALFARRSQAPAAPPLPDLNVRLLRWVLRLMAIGALAYLLAGWAGVPFNRLFPWDGLGLLALCGLAELLLRRGRSFWASSAVLGGFCIPIAFNAQYYGMASPVNALYGLGLLVSGLVAGSNGFLGMLAAISMLTALFAIGEQQGIVEPVYPVGAPAQSAGLVLFWWAVYGATAWLSWLFARTLERAVHAARGQTLALAHTLQTITPDSSLEAVLAQTLAAITEQLTATRAQLWLRAPDDDTLGLRLAYQHGQLVAAEQMPSSPPPLPAAGLPAWQALVATRQPVVIDHVANDPRVVQRGLALGRGTHTLLYVPLLAGGEVTGFFSLENIETRRYSPEELELAQALVQQVTLTMQLGQLAEQSRQSAILAERNRMAREIHDTLAQGFTGIVVQLEAAEDVLGEAGPAARQHLSRARALARESLAEARRSVYALRLPALEHAPLPAALRASVEALAAAAALAVEWSVDAGWPALPVDLELDLLRIGQEAVTNVLRHAQARSIWVALKAEPERLTLEISDDGRGLDPAGPRGGLGLLGMQERAARHGGVLAVRSRPIGGTTIRCQVPRPTEPGQSDAHAGQRV